MKSNKIKTYLMQYRESLRRSAEIELHLKELQNEAYMLKTHEGQSIALDTAALKYLAACDNAAAELAQISEMRDVIKNEIECVKEDRLRNILFDVYINGKNLVCIAAEAGKSYEYICRLHGYALKEIEKIIQNEIPL